MYIFRHWTNSRNREFLADDLFSIIVCNLHFPWLKIWYISCSFLPLKLTTRCWHFNLSLCSEVTYSSKMIVNKKETEGSRLHSGQGCSVGARTYLFLLDPILGPLQMNAYPGYRTYQIKSRLLHRYNPNYWFNLAVFIIQTILTVCRV